LEHQFFRVFCSKQLCFLDVVWQNLGLSWCRLLQLELHGPGIQCNNCPGQNRTSWAPGLPGPSSVIVPLAWLLKWFSRITNAMSCF
jgi:hypothetical protein